MTLTAEQIRKAEQVADKIGGLNQSQAKTAQRLLKNQPTRS